MLSTPRRLVVALALCAWACGAETGAELPRPTNLLVICVDTLRSDPLGAYGAQPSVTPHIDALAEGGIVFERAVSHASWTLPSFASILTSLNSSTHGCWNFDCRLSEGFVTLPELFRAAGFETAGIASHVFFNDRYGLQQGFDSFDDELAVKRGAEGWVAITSPLVSEKAVRWLRQRQRSGADGPWLLWVHFFDPHQPYLRHGPRAPGEPEPGDFERYRGEIEFTDRHVGAILAALERQGLAQETAVVFLSDHGESFGERSRFRGHAKSFHAEELHVPLIVRVPGLEPRRVPETVGTVDLLPTLVELFGLTHTEPIEGRSLLSAMGGEELPPRPILSEIRLFEDFQTRGVVRGRWKLIQNTGSGRTQLFDLDADPQELSDLISERPALAEELRAEMLLLERRASLLGERFGGGEQIELSPGELQHLQDLGYVDGDG